MTILESPDLPPANGHYSQCIIFNKVLYVAGQLPVDPVSKTVPETIEAQTDLVLNKVDIILKSAGVTRNEVIQVRLYIDDIALWDKVNERYKVFFGDHKPVRCIVPVKTLHYGCLIEVEITAQAEK
jgi:2-iminobutanoate/2-iminopropanoate deaminase